MRTDQVVDARPDRIRGLADEDPEGSTSDHVERQMCTSVDAGDPDDESEDLESGSRDRSTDRFR